MWKYKIWDKMIISFNHTGTSHIMKIKWQLDNFLLTNKKILENVSKEADEFFIVNWDSTGNIMVWKAFKSFIQGIMITQKIFKNRSRQEYRGEILKQTQKFD